MTTMFQLIVWCRYGACIVTYLITLRYRHQRSTVSVTSGYVTRTSFQSEMVSVLSTAKIFSTLSARKPTTGSAVCDPPIGPLLRQPPLQGSPSKRPAGPRETDSTRRPVGLRLVVYCLQWLIILVGREIINCRKMFSIRCNDSPISISMLLR